MGIAIHQQLADAMAKQSVAAGAATPAVRGGDWQTAIVTAAPGNGTVSVGVIVARCLDSYPSPAVGDSVFLTQSSAGSWVAVGRISSADAGVGGQLFRRKTADDAVPDTLTLTNDTHLFMTVAANAIYTIDGQLFTLGADFTSDIRVGYSYPASAEIHFGGPGPGGALASGGQGNAEFVARQSPDALSTFVPYGTSTSRLGTPLKGLLIVGATAGTLRLQWARNATGGGAVTVRAASWLKLTRES